MCAYKFLAWMKIPKWTFRFPTRLYVYRYWYMIEYALICICMQVGDFFGTFLEKQLCKRNVSTYFCLWWKLCWQFTEGKADTWVSCLAEKRKKFQNKPLALEDSKAAANRSNKVNFRTCLKQDNIHLVKAFFRIPIIQT